MARPTDTSTGQSQRSGLQIAASCMVVCIAVLVPLLWVVAHIDPHAGHTHLSDNEGRSDDEPDHDESAIPAAPHGRRQPLFAGDMPLGRDFVTTDSRISAVESEQAGIQTVSAADATYVAGALTPMAAPLGRTPGTTPSFQANRGCETTSHCEAFPVEIDATDSEPETDTNAPGPVLTLVDTDGPAALARTESSIEAEPWQWRPLSESDEDLPQAPSEFGELVVDVSDEADATDPIAVNMVQTAPQPKSEFVSDVTDPIAVNTIQTASQPKSESVSDPVDVPIAKQEKSTPFVVPTTADRRLQFFSAGRNNDDEVASARPHAQHHGGNAESHDEDMANQIEKNSSGSGLRRNAFHLAAGERDSRQPLRATNTVTSNNGQHSQHTVAVDEHSISSVPQIVIHNHINTPAVPAVPPQSPPLDPRIAQLEDQIAELTQAINHNRVKESEIETSVALQQQERATMAVDANTAALQEIRLSLAELRQSLRESQMKENEASRRLAAQVSEFMTAVEVLQDSLSTDHVTTQLAIQPAGPPEPLYPPATARETQHARPSMTAQRPRTTDFPGSPLIRPRSTGPVSTRTFAVRQPQPVQRFRSARAATSPSVSTDSPSINVYPPIESPKPTTPPASPLPVETAPPTVTWPAPRQIPVPLPKTIGTESPAEIPDNRSAPGLPGPLSTGLRVPSDSAVNPSPIPLPFPPQTVKPLSQPAASRTDSASMVPKKHAAQALSERNHAYVFDAPPADRDAKTEVIHSVTAVHQGTSTVNPQKTRTASVSVRPADNSDQYTAHPTSPVTGHVKLPEVRVPQLRQTHQIHRVDSGARAIRSSSQPGFMTRTRTRIGDITDSITDLRPAWMEGLGRRASERQRSERASGGLSRVGNGTSGRFGRVRSRKPAGSESKTMHRTGAFFNHLFRPNSVSP